MPSIKALLVFVTEMRQGNCQIHLSTRCHWQFHAVCKQYQFSTYPVEKLEDAVNLGPVISTIVPFLLSFTEHNQSDRINLIVPILAYLDSYIFYLKDYGWSRYHSYHKKRLTLIISQMSMMKEIRGQRPISDRTYFRHIYSLGVNFMQLWFVCLKSITGIDSGSLPRLYGEYAKLKIVVS